MKPLSKRLREETRDAHTLAERAALMRRIFRGTIDRATYAALLANLHALYARLESLLDTHAGDPIVAPMRFAELDRVPSIARDLAFLRAHGVAEEPAVTDATRGYVGHLEALSGRDPALLIAHAYVRYLGDLSGGQMLRGMVQRGLGLPDGEGVAFYDFDRVADIPEAKARYRAGLDAMPLDARRADLLVQEARRAFELNLAIFESIDAGDDDADAPAP